MRRFLISLSGARPEILDRCPSERTKYEGIGGAVLTTSVLATLSMWFAIHSALGVNPFIAAPIALGWGAAIMSLDRWLVTSIPAEGKRGRYAAPRIVMAVLLGAVISTPLVLQIFKSEIDAQIVQIKQERSNSFTADQRTGEVGRQVAALQKQVDSLQEVVRSRGDVPLDPAADPEIKTLERQRNERQKDADKHYKEWQCQLYGGDGCPRKGEGPLAEASKEAYDKARNDVQGLNRQIEARKTELAADSEAAKSTRLQQATAELPKVQQQLQDARQRQRTLQIQYDAENAETDGLLIRLQALSEVSRGDFTLVGVRTLLFLFFLLIECLPVFVKLMMKPGNYDRILALEVKREMREARAGTRPAFASGFDSGPRPDAGPDPGPDPGVARRPGSILPIWSRKDEETDGDVLDDPAAADTRVADGYPDDDYPRPRPSSGRGGDTVRGNGFRSNGNGFQGGAADATTADAYDDDALHGEVFDREEPHGDARGGSAPPASDDEAIRRISDTRAVEETRATPDSPRDADGQPLYDDDDY
ncbi:DUF4407 domain-containing protein [Actinomadura algeriensis]|uniref:DUF4407 domain-containing protein n=1 Tax=Actinomadura algeriensis TaxID=1679523 RepID=A0ABR9JJH6_9ACTN|nr:DUF4407 domain-containing protein [Actinomadura algeriensis]MBE1530706.1 hypothetical protein [Actinomadura algeriensis]